MTRSHYRRQLLRLYRSLPDTPHRCHRGDHAIVDQLFDHDVPLTRIEAALLLGSARRASREPSLPKLHPIRSLAYFLPVLRELPATPPPDGYLDYLRHTLNHALREQETHTRSQLSALSRNR